MNSIATTFANRRNDRPKLVLKPKQPKRWSHQQELEALKGKKIQIKFQDRSDVVVWWSAVLLNADQFTLQLEVDWLVLGTKSVLTYNKSAIAAYRAA